MVGFDELKKMIRRNMFLGMWAAEKLGLTGESAEAYAKALSVGTLEPEGRDVFGIIRKDFDAAGVVQSDEQILNAMNEFTLQAADPRDTTAGSTGAAAVMIARNLSPRRTP
jgi:hypothetical protein